MKKIITTKSEKFLEQYLNNASPTGFESPGQKLWMDYMRPYADEFIVDNYGSVAAVINPGQPYKVVIEAHADEISWFVHYITSDGFIYLRRNGGSDHMIAPSKRVNIHTDKGIVRAVFGWPAIHMRQTKDDPPTMKNIFLDCGCSTKEEVEKLGVHVGCVATFEDEFMVLNKNRYVGRALDNRVGGFMIAEVARQGFAIGATRLRRTERVDLQTHSGDTESSPKRRRHRNELGVDIRARKTDGFDVDLMKLTEPTLLRFFVTKHRSDAPHLVSRTAQHAVRDHRAHDTGGGFRTQGETLTAFVLEAVHLFLDDVRELADSTLEEISLLDDRDAHFFECIRAQNFAGDRLEPLPSRNLARQNVVHALDGLDERRSHRAGSVTGTAGFTNGCRFAAASTVK